MRYKMIWLLCGFLFISLIGMAQNKQTVSFKVYGNCEMCKSNIENSLKKKDGIIEKKWDMETHVLTVTYKPARITIGQIGKKVADAGYDNEYAVAPDAAYNSLHGCCKYDRPKK
jgi:mercuric ion binding protein